MQTSQINFKIDSKLKKEVEKLAAALGFSVSSLLKAFLLQFKRTKKVNFSLKEDLNDPFGDGLTGKDVEREMIKYGYSKEESKRNGKSYDDMLQNIKEGKLIKY